MIDIWCLPKDNSVTKVSEIYQPLQGNSNQYIRQADNTYLYQKEGMIFGMERENVDKTEED